MAYSGPQEEKNGAGAERNVILSAVFFFFLSCLSCTHNHHNSQGIRKRKEVSVWAPALVKTNETEVAQCYM